MHEQLLAKHQLTTEDGALLTLSYYLLAEELLDKDGVPICEMYGAKIVKERAEQTVTRSIPRITVLGSEIMRIVESTALLQPTVSMAVLRLEENGAIERGESVGESGRRPMRRNSGCVLTEKGREMAQEIAAKVREL